MEEFGDELLFPDRYAYPYHSPYVSPTPRIYRAGFLLEKNAHNALHDLLLVADFDGTIYSPYGAELSQFMLCIDEDLTCESIDKLKRNWPLKPHQQRENFLNRVIRGYEKHMVPFDGGPGPFLTKRERRAYLGQGSAISHVPESKDDTHTQMLLRICGLENVPGKFLRM